MAPKRGTVEYGPKPLKGMQALRGSQGDTWSLPESLGRSTPGKDQSSEDGTIECTPR